MYTRLYDVECYYYNGNMKIHNPYSRINLKSNPTKWFGNGR